MSSSLVTFNFVLNLPVCTAPGCGYAIDIESLKGHLRKRHKLSSGAACEIEQGMNEKHQSALHNNGGMSEHTFRMTYLATCDAQNSLGSALPAVPGLPIEQCLRCPDCGYIAPKTDTMRKHMNTMPCSGDIPESPALVSAQSIYGGNKRRYFEVIDSSNPAKRSCAISETMIQLQGSKPANSDVSSNPVSQMDAFLATMRFDKHLQACDVSLNEAHRLCDISESPMRSSLGILVAAYHKSAFDISETKVYIKSHSFMESDLSIALSSKSVINYDARVSRLMHFVFSCCENEHPLAVHFSPQFRANVAELKRLMESARESGSRSGLKQLHFILYDLLFSPTKDDNDGLMVFISCASVIVGRNNQTTRFATASDLSPLLAAVKHFARCAVIVEVYGYGQNDTVAGWERIEKATGPHSDTVIHFAKHCLKVCNRIRESESYKARFMICPNHELCAYLDGIELSLQHLGDKMRLLQDNAWRLLVTLLNGLELTQAFWDSVPKLQDCLSDLTPGYWFGVHGANNHVHEYWSHSLLQRYRTILLQTNGNVNKPSAQTFLNHCEELQGLLYTLMQTCSGAPARATELGVVRVCNTDIGVRNIFFNGGHLFTVVSYHKGRNMEDGVGRPVARYPDSVTAGLLAAYLLIVRPLESALVNLLDNSQPIDDANVLAKHSNESTRSYSAGSKHRDYLFVTHGNPLTVDRLRYLFEKNLKSVGIPFGTSQYRQYHSGVIKNFFGSDEREKRGISASEGSVPTLHKQAGHSEQTAHQIYGVSALDMRNLTGTELEAFRQASKTWHNALGLRHGGPCLAEDATSQSSPESLTTHKEPSPNDGLQTITARLTELESVPAILKRLEKEVYSLSRLVKDRASVRKREIAETDFQAEQQRQSKKSRTSMLSELKLKMREFIGNGDAEFHTKEQESAVFSSINADSDCLVVLPTGAGKSLTFMLSAYMLVNKVVIVIVPLVALQKDLMIRCRNAGLQAAQWSSRDVAGAKVIIASVEHVNTTGYQAFVRELHATERLHAIFIDEAHLTLLWLKFREPMRVIHKYIRPEPVKVPVIALTATAPPSLEKHIANACGMSDWSTVRSETSRSNICYEMHDVSKDQIVREVDSSLCKHYKRSNSSDFRAIVYTQTRTDCEMITSTLSALSPDIPCYKYHAGMNDDERADMQRKWMSSTDGKAHVMVATSAFGCGIDVPTVRVVVHAGLPRTLMEYLQESGRAGRDREPALSIVLNTGHSTVTRHSTEDRLPFAGAYVQLETANDAVLKWDDDMFGSVVSLSQNSSKCRRWLLDEFADGTPPAGNCNEREMELCDVCQLSIPANVKASATGPHVPTSSLGRRDSESPENSHKASTATKSTSTASAEEISQGFGSRVDASLCPVCTVENRRLVSHRNMENEKNWLCYRRRCLRCALPGHGAKVCQMFRSRETSRACLSCGFRKLDGVKIHETGEYGKSFCRVKKMMCLAVLCYENPDLQKRMMTDLPGVAGVKSVEELPRWLYEDPNELLGESRAGLKFFVPWFFNDVLNVDK